MNTKSQLSQKLKSLGFLLESETNAYNRFCWPLGKGSLYVKEDYISATGAAKSLEYEVPRISSDSKGCPEWRGQALSLLLNSLESSNQTSQSQSLPSADSQKTEEVNDTASALSSPEIQKNAELLNAYMQNFFGYGSLSSPLWFIGMEEGVGEESLENRLDAWETLGKTPTIDIREFHRMINEARWFSHSNIHPANIQRTWKGLININLAYLGMPGGKEAIRKYQIEKLATDDLALLELMPLPHKSLSYWNYQHIYPNRNLYINQIAPQRIGWIKKQVVEFNPKAIIMYGTTPPYPDYWLKIAEKPLQAHNGLSWVKKGKTIYVACLHPVAHGVTDAYFTEIGRFLKSIC
jgi:hypothetical protein